MSKTINIPVDEEDVKAIQRAHIETESYTENLKFMLDNPQKGFDKELIEEYTKKKAASELEFERLKAKAGKKYIPAEIFGAHEYKWTIDYGTSMLNLEVICDCGIEILDKLGF